MWGEPIVGVLARIPFPQFALPTLHFQSDFFVLLRFVAKSPDFGVPPKKKIELAWWKVWQRAWLHP
jgi:hypothetical protein